MRRGAYALGERTDHGLPGFIQIRGGNLALARQDLPETHVGLENAQRIGPQRDIRNAVNGVRRSEKTGDGVVVQSLKLRKNQVLVAVPGKFLRQQTDRLRTHALTRRPRAVDRTQHQVDPQRPVFRALPGEGEQRFHQLIGIFPMVGTLGPLADHFGVGLLPENLLPHFQISGNRGLAGGIQLKAGHQEQQVGIGPEHGTGRARRNIFSRSAS